MYLDYNNVKRINSGINFIMSSFVSMHFFICILSYELSYERDGYDFFSMLSYLINIILNPPPKR